jgi:inosose dehydratase
MPKLGFHPCIWKCGTDLVRFWEAVGDMAAAGWDGFEVAGPLLEPYYDRPDEFARLLADHGMELSTVYSGHSFAEPQAIGAEIERVRRLADFCRAVGCEVLLIDGGTKQSGQHHGEADYERVARAANRMGEAAREHGLTCAWHQHWGTMFEFPPAFHRLMALTDPDLVKFCPDTAQLSLGLFDLPEVFTEYLDRIAYVHFKDLDSNRRFIELGSGTIDFAPLWQLLQSRHYEGWIVVDLDYTSLEVCESCQANREYLRELGIPGRG